MEKYLESVLHALGWTREDAKYTSVLEKKLEYVKSKVYETIYPQFKARKFLPVSNEADSADETITYQQMDTFGMATFIANFADDLPLIEALAEDYTVKVKSLGAAYQYSVQDLRRAAKTGNNLATRKANGCRRSVEQRIEDIAATGNTAFGLTGLANNSNVTLVSPTTGTWSGATAAEIIADVDKLLNAVDTATKGVYPARNVLFDESLYNIIKRKRVSTTGDTIRTVLQDLTESNPDVTFDRWNKLATADVAGTGPRIIAYTKDPEVCSLEIPQEYETYPPQAKNLAFITNTHARCAGVLIPIPVALAYMDGC